jgi:hypothetical protein
MPKNKRLPDELLAKLHGKGTMSEILDIERARLLKQSEQDMRRQLGQLESHGSAAQPSDSGAVAVPLLPPLVPADISVSREPESEQTIPPSAGAGIDNITSARHRTTPTPANVDSYRINAVDIDTYQPAASEAFPPRLTSSWPATPSRGVEGFSVLSRVVGDDLSELGIIFRHSVETVSAPPRFSPEAAQAYYTQRVEPLLPFTAQRNLLGAIRRLTLGWGALSCQITLELLSNASGIRNFKTLRKWLADLNRRNLIRYTPVHGDLRGSVVTLTPPSEVRAEIERWWHEGSLQANRVASRSEAS